MELKLQPADMSGLSGLRVLIVPYGIEMANNLTDRADIEVLIVPYGIEILTVVREKNPVEKF